MIDIHAYIHNSKDKGAKYLIESLDYIDKKVKCLIIGDGPDYSKLKSLSKGKDVKFIRRA